MGVCWMAVMIVRKKMHVCNELPVTYESKPYETLMPINVMRAWLRKNKKPIGKYAQMGNRPSDGKWTNFTGWRWFDGTNLD